MKAKHQVRVSWTTLGLFILPLIGAGVFVAVSSLAQSAVDGSWAPNSGGSWGTRSSWAFSDSSRSAVATTLLNPRATGTVVRVGDKITEINVINGGSGYTTPPTVIISDPGANGFPARGVALISNGVVTGVDIVDSGSGYVGTASGTAGTPTGIPTVIFSGEIEEINMSETGSGYSSAPSIAFTGGGAFNTPPTVTFRGGIGAGAVATAVIGTGGSAGRVVSITVNNGGGGYSTTTLPPIQIFSTSGGTGATATAIVNGSGVITGFNVTNQGSGYSGIIPPSVVIGSPTPTSPGGGTNTFVATGTAVVVEGQVFDVEITNSGVGYTTAPQVIFSGGGAVGNGNVIATAEVDAGVVTGVTITNPGGVLNATGTATLGAGGGVSSIAVTSRGVGYTSAPTVVIGAPLIRQALISSSRSGTSVSSITVTNPGSGYLVNPAVTFSNVGWRGYTAAPRVKFTKSGVTGALATATRNGTTGGITAVAVQDGGNGYSVAPTVVFVGGNGTGAVASVTVAGGLVTASNVTAGGSGYGGVPTVTLSGGGGTGATATAVVTNSVVTGLNITNPGSGYTSAPTVTFTSIPVTNPATATAIITAGKVTGVTVDTPGSYTSPPIVAFSTGGVTHAVATAAVPNGELATLTLVYGGSGYAAVAPTISFEGSISNGGSHATATASLTSGVVTGLNITSPGGAIRAAATSTRAPDGTIASVTVTMAGTGYISDPIVTLAAPTGVTTAVQPVPGGVGAFLHFNRDITGNFGITLEAARTVGSLTIGDTGGEDYTLSAGTGGVTSSLTFDMGLLGAGKSFLNKTQGDQDVISARVVLNDELNARINAGRLTMNGGIAGTGTLLSTGAGILTITGAATGSNIDLWLWHRGGTGTGAQVELGATGGNAFGNIRLGNGSYGTAGFAVLQLLENRVLSLADPALYQGDQISDSATVIVDAAANRWGYFKLMGGSETIGNIIDSGSALVLENMEGETINTNAVLTLGGNNLDSFVGGFIRNRSGGSGTGTLGLTKNGTGALTLQGGNITYTGPTLLNGGTLNLVNTTGFASSITAAAGTRLNVDTLTGATNFDEAVLGDSVLWKLGTGTLNFNSGQTKLDEVFHTGGSIAVRAGAATLRDGKNEISGTLTVQGDSGLNKSVTLTAGLSVGGINANGRFGQTGSIFGIIGQQFNADSVGNAVEGVLESSGPINITNMSMLLGGNLFATDRVVQNTATSTTILTLTDVSNLVIGSVLTLKLSESTAGVTIQRDTKLLAVNQNNRTVILDKTASIPSGRGITFTYTSVTDGAVRGESLNFTDVVHDGQKFIAITEKGTVHTSLNGTIWDLRYTDPAGIPFNSLIWNGERAVIVGSQGRVLTSADGRAWAVQDVGSATDLRGVTSTNIAFTGNLAAGSATVSNVTGAATFLPGTPVFGFATAPDARVATANAAGNSLTVDSPALDTATNVDFGYFRGNTTAGNSTVSAVKTAQNLQVGTAISGAGIQLGTTISVVDGPNNGITLSLNASVGGTVTLFTLTGNLTFNSSTITNLSNTQGLAVGMVLTGRGIPAGTRITAINAGAATLTLSDTATTTTSAVPMSIYTGTLAASSNLVTNVTSLGAFTADMAARGVLVPVGTFVVSSTTNTLTLSQPATVAATSGDLKASKTSRISTGTFANGNAVVTNVSNLTGLAVGMQVALPGVIPAGTVISAINAPNLTLSNPTLTGPVTLAFSAGFDIVAVGENGFVSTSAGGGTGTWFTRSSGTTRDLNAISWSESLLVAVGELGRMITSPDGVTWTRQSPPLTDPTNGAPNVIMGVNVASKTVTMNNNALVDATQASFGAFKGDTIAGSAVITNVTGMPSLRPGLPLTSTLGIAAGATIRSVNEAGFSFVMSTPATGTATAAPIRTFTGLAVNGQTLITDVTDFKGLVVGMELHGSAITGTSVIISLDPENREIFLSSPATASGRGSFGAFYGDLTIGSATVSNVTNMTSLRNLRGTTHFTINMVVLGAPLIGSANITAIASDTLTLTQSATATSTNVDFGYFRGNTTTGSNTITSVRTAQNLQVGTAISAATSIPGNTGLPANTTISVVNGPASTLTLSANATAGGTFPLNTLTGQLTLNSSTVTNLSNTQGLAVGMVLAGSGIPFGACITSINTGAASLTLSDAASVTAAAVPMSIYMGTLSSGSNLVQNVTSLGAFKAVKVLNDVPGYLGPGLMISSYSPTANSLILSGGTAIASASGVPLLTLTGRVTDGSNIITNVSDFTGIAVNMNLFVTGTTFGTAAYFSFNIDSFNSAAGTITLSGVPNVNTETTAVTVPLGLFLGSTTASSNIVTALTNYSGRAAPSIRLPDLQDVSWTGTQFVAVGDYGAVFTSSTGVTWTPRNSTTGRDLQAVALSGAQILAAGEDGIILKSANGVAWTSARAPDSPALNDIRHIDQIQAVITSNGKTLALGNGGLATTDVNTWFTSLNDVAALNNTFSGTQTTLAIGGNRTTAGSLQIDNSVTTSATTTPIDGTLTNRNNPNRIDDATTLMSRGGNFFFVNNGANATFSEKIGKLLLSQGDFSIIAARAGITGTSTLTFDSLQQMPGATLNFTGVDGSQGSLLTVPDSLGVNTRNQILFTQAPVLDDGIIGGWATQDGEWATYGVNGVTSLETYDTGDQTGWISTDNVKMQAARTLNARRAINSLNLVGQTLTMNGLQLSIESGGLLATSGTINSAGAALVVGTPKTQPKNLNIINSSTLTLNTEIEDFQSDLAVSATSAGATLVSMPSIVGLMAGMEVSNVVGTAIPVGTRIESVDVANSRITLTAATTASIAANTLVRFTGGSVGLTKSGAGLLALTRTNTYSGKTYINVGTVRITATSALGAAPTSFVQDQIQINGGALQIGHIAPTAASATPLPDHIVSFNDNLRGITIGLAGGRIQVGQSDPDNNNATVTSAVPIVNLTITNPINALGTLELAVHSNTGLQQYNTLTLGTAASTNTYAGGIKTEALFEGLITILGNNTIGGIVQEGGKFFITGNNNFTAPIRSLLGDITITGSNTWFGGDEFERPIEIQGGTLKLTTPNALGTGGLSLVLGSGGKLTLAGLPLSIRQITSTTLSVITNDDAPESLTSPTELTFNLNTNQIYNGTIEDGATLGDTPLTAPIKLIKTGPGMLTLNNAASDFTGGIEIREGALNVTNIDTLSNTSALGQVESYDPALLLIDKAVLSFTPTDFQTMDRSFTMGTGPNGATLVANGVTQIDRVTIGKEFRDAFGGNPEISDPIAFKDAGSRILTLSGSGRGDNTLLLELRDKSISEISGLMKAGQGTWVLDKAAPFSGYTTINDGTLVVTKNDALGTVGASTVVNAANDTLTGNLPNGTPLTFPLFYDTTLPGGVLADTAYYVVGSDSLTNTFQIAATPGGAALPITTNGLNVKIVSKIDSFRSTVFDENNNTFTGSLPIGAQVSFNTQLVPGVATPQPPGGLLLNTVYYVVVSTGSTFKISETPGGPVFDFSTGTPGSLYYSTPDSGNPSGGVNLTAGTLELRSVNYLTPETLYFEGGQLLVGADTQSIWSGDLHVNASATIRVGQGGQLTLNGNFLGTSFMTQEGEGDVIMRGEMLTATTNLLNATREYAVRAGTLILDYSLNNGSKLSNTANLRLGGSRRGGTIVLSGGSHEEIVGQGVLEAGASKIYRDGGTSTISLNNISRSTGSSLYVDLARIAKTDVLNNNGILGSWAIIRDAVTNAFYVIPGTNSATIPVTADASTDRVSATGLAFGTLVRLTTTGTMPGGLSENTNYFVINASPLGVTLALTPSVIAQIADITSAGTGTLTLTTQTSFTANAGSDTFTTPGDHRLAEGSVVRVSSYGTLPSGLSAGTDYYVIDRANRSFRLSAVIDGPAVNIISVGTGVHTVETQGVEKRIGSAALTFSVNPAALPGSDGNGKIKVAIRPQVSAGAITSEITGLGTVLDPYIYTIKTTTDNNSNSAVLAFVTDDPNNPSVGSGKLIVAESSAGGSSDADLVADIGSYGAPTFLAYGSNDNGGIELDWARNEGAADGFIMPNASYANAWSTLNHTAVTSNISAGNIDTYSLRFASQNASTVTMAGATTRAIRTGGILISPTVGANDSSIVGTGSLTMGGQGNLQNFLVHQYNELGSLIIGTRVTNRAAITRTGRLSSAANNVVAGLSTTSDLTVGMLVTGAGITAGTTIASIDPDGHTIFLSQGHSVNATRPTLSFSSGGPAISRAGTLVSGDRRRIFGITVPGVGVNPSTVSTTDLYIGMPIAGPGIPVGSTITFIFDDNDIQVSTNHFFTGESSVMTLTPTTGIEKLGPGMLVLSGENDYTGTTFIGNGVLRAQSLTDGGVPGSLGASNAASANLFFNGGELQYVGENSRTNRGFQLSEFASINIGHERTSSVFTGAIAGTDRLEKDGPGTLIFNGNAGLESIRVEQGRLLLQSVDTNFTPAGFAGTNFATTNLTSLRVAGGTLELRGTPEGNVNQIFGSQFVVEEGGSEVKVTSVASKDPNNLVAVPAFRTTSLSLMGQEEQTEVLRLPGGTVRFVENPEENAGPANILLLQPLASRQRILPWATYRNLGDTTQEGVNDFATVNATTAAVISASLLYLNGSAFMDPDPDSNPYGGWARTRLPGLGMDVSEGGLDPNGNIRTFNGTINSRRYVNLMRYESNLNSVITIDSGQTLELISGAILSAFDVRTGNKQILGPGNITGGTANTINADFIMHNYNPASAFTIGASVVDRTVLVANSTGTLGRGTLKIGEATMQIEDGTTIDFFSSARAGMQISGPGLPPGTVVLEVDSDNRRLLLTQSATSDQTSQIYTLSEILNFVQTGVGTTILSGDNTYSGNTYVHGGVLRLNSTNAVPGGIGSTGGTSALIVEGGVIGLGLGDFARSLGSGADQVQFKGNGGFAAYGADRLVNFGGGSVPEVLRFGNNGFVPDGSSLILGSHDATHKIVFQHPIDLSAFSQAVRVENGPAVVEAELAGGLSGLGRMIKFGLGTLRLNATSTNTGGIELAEGRLIAANVPNVFGSTAGTASPLRLGTSYTNTDTRSALELEIEGGTVAKKLEIGAVNAASSPWIAGGQVDSSQASSDVGHHVSMLVVEGYPAMAYYDVTNGDLKYVRALDDRGTHWGIPVTVASRNNVGKYPSMCLINGFPAISYYDETNGSLMYVRATDAAGAFWGTPIPVVAQAETVLTVAVQTDGKVLVGGAFTQIDGVLKNRLIRLNTNGSMDDTFEAFVMNGEVRDILIQADGKIIIGGTFTAVRQNDTATNNLTRNRIARLNTDGSLDVGFDPNLNGDVRVLMAQGDGRFLVGGAFTAVGGAGRTRMARLNVNGTLDATFVSPDIRNGEVRDIVLEPAGTYVICGNFTSVRGDGNRNRLARITSNGGAIDAFNPDANGDVNAVVLLPDAKLLVGGSFGAFVGGVISRTRLARLNPNGTVDLTFAQEVNGTVTRLELESTGDVLVAGQFTQLGDFARNSLGRVKADGTVLVSDIVAGSAGSAPDDLSAVGSTLYFAANDAVKGTELWKSDGTVGGTVLVKDIVAGGAGSVPANLTAMGNTLFFTATDPFNGRELWKSDGTDVGTVLVKDIVLGATGSSPANLTVVDNTLFFTATDAANGTELWKSDGTEGGTVLVKDIVTGTTGSAPTNLTALDGTLFFAADDTVNGRELWKSNGTAGGTELVLDIVSGATGSSPASLTAIGSTLLFAADDTVNGRELWKSDGTAMGTELVADIVVGAAGSSPTSLTAVGSNLFFAATDPTVGSELWKSDGTAIGTILVKDILAGASGSAPTNFSAVGTTLYFSAAEATNGRELWKSDGTAGGTALLRDISVGAADSSPTKAVVAGSTLYFTANDAVNGRELWKSDGTAFGTIDATFNPNPDQEVRDIFLMTDGKIVLGGLFSRLNGATQQVVARTSAAGVPDVGFLRRIIDVGQYTSLLFVNGVPAIAFRDVFNTDLEYVRANDANGAGWAAAQVLDGSADNVGVGISMIIANIGGDILTKDDRGTISETDDEVTISATAANIGTPVIAYGDATNSSIKYVVAINANGTGLTEPLTSWSNPVVLPNTGNVGAQFSLSLVDGFPAIAYQTADTKDLKFMRAANVAGITNNLRDPVTLEILRKFVSELVFSAATSWDSPIILDSAGDVGQSPSLALVNGQPTTVKDRPAVTYYDATNGNLKYVVAPNSTGAPINSATPNDNPWGAPTVLASQNDVGMFTSLAMVNGHPGVGYYNATSGDLAFLLLNDASGYSRISFDGDSTWSGAVTLNGSLMIAPASGLTASLTGALTGGAGFKLVSDGILNLTNAANNFGTSLALPGVTTGPGAAVNGAAIIRSGTLQVSSSTALGGATVELGDALPQVISVDRATGFGTVLADGGSFIALHDGRNRNVNGPGAFVEVGATVDGHYYGLVATTADPAIDTLTGNLTAGTEIQLIGELLPPGTAADTSYYVINPTGTNFRISLTSGGAPVSISGVGSKVFFIETAKLNAKILVKDENHNPERNGIYQFMIDPDNTSLAENVMNLARVAAFDSSAEMLYGVRVSVQNGTSAGKAYFLAGNVIDVNYSAVHWVEDRLNSSVTLLATVAGLTISNPVDVNAMSGTGSSMLGAANSVTTGLVNFTGAVTLQNQLMAVREDETLNLTSFTSTGLGLVLSGVISEADGGAGVTKDRLTLIKTGTGTTTLSGNNTFGGGLAINQGTLLIMNTPVLTNDSATGTGAVAVNAGTVLGGIGTIGGAVTLTGAPGNSAVLRPGDPTSSLAPVETLTINQPIVVGADSVIEFSIGAANFTRLAGASLNLSTATSRILVQIEPGYLPVSGMEFELLDLTGSLTIFGGAANLLNLLQLPATTVWDTSIFMSTGKIISEGDAQPPAITDDPDSLTVQQGQNATFTIAGGYTGTALSFQWSKDGNDIDGATTDTLVITGATQASEGAYRVRVSNGVIPAGVLSNPAILTVDWPLSFAVNLPATKRGSVGDPITFSVIMNGEGPITYQWKKGITDVGTDSPTFTIPSVTLADQATYSVLVKGPFNPAGISSVACVFTASAGPAVVLESPVSQTVLAGSSLNLVAAPGGDNNARVVQWRRNGVAIAGANTNTLAIPSITIAQAGDYTFKVDNKVIATGKASSAISDPARIVVVDNPNSIVAAQLGKQVVLTVNVAGPTAVKPVFEWLKNNGPLPADGRFTGGNTKSLTIKLLAHTDSDVYTCRVTGAAGTTSVIGGTQLLRVYDAAPQLVETTAPPAGIVGGAYYWKIPVISDVTAGDVDHVAKWKTTPSTYAVSPLPAGLKVDPKTGVISGRPTAPNTATNPLGYPVVITVSNAILPKDTWSTIIDIRPLPSGVAGVYAGPIARDPILNGNLGGRFDMTVTTAGVASGKVTLGSAAARPFTVSNGSLEIDVNGNDPQATLIIPATTTLPSLTISFKLDRTPGTLPAPPATLLSDATITAGSNPPVTFEGWRNNWAATAVTGVSAKADTFAGDYTFGIMLSDGSPLIANPQVPQGAGYGILKVATAGTFTLAGRTPDGETLTGGYWLGPNGQFFVFQTLYTTTTKGSLLGKLQIEANTPSTDNDLFGDLTHVRPPNNGSVTTARTYRSGFGTTQTATGVTPTTVTTPVTLIAVGGRYIAPLATGPVFMGLDPFSDPNRNAELIFSEDGLLPARTTVFPAAYDKDIAAAFNPNIAVTLDVKSAVKTPLAKSADNPASTTFAPVVATGAFSGKFTLSDSIPRPPQAPLVIARSVSYLGVVIRERTSVIGQPRVVENYGVGHFIIDQLPPTPATPANSTPRLSGMASFQAP